MVAGAALAATAALAGPLDGEVVVLDPGHNGRNHAHPDRINKQVDIGTGRKACDTTGTAGEPAFTWDVAKRTRTLLRERGARVVFTRRSPSFRGRVARGIADGIERYLTRQMGAGSA